MKQLMLIAMLLLSSLGSIGDTPSSYGEELKKEIKKKVGYPDFAKAEKLDGMVMVKFLVNEEGRVQVLEINASHDHLANYVTDRLEGIRVDDSKAKGEHFARFRFRFVEI